MSKTARKEDDISKSKVATKTSMQKTKCAEAIIIKREHRDLMNSGRRGAKQLQLLILFLNVAFSERTIRSHVCVMRSVHFAEQCASARFALHPLALAIGIVNAPNKTIIECTQRP
jgi:hypothetical protein